MRFLFATDLHGDLQKYERLGELAPNLGAEAIVIGGDIAPKFVRDIFEDQAKFYEWMREWADTLMMPVYAYLGNDDVKCLLDKFLEECEASGNLYALEGVGDIGFYTYARQNNVPDTPFGLKDWSRRDYDGWVSPPQLAAHSVESERLPHDKGFRFRELKSLDKFLKGRPTIEEDLAKVQKVDIMFSHCPPSGLQLDVCHSGDRPGSRALLDWIDREKPSLVLSGHLHESYRLTGVWRAYRGPTMVVQPGDRHFVIVDMDRDKVVGRAVATTQIMSY